MKVFLIILFLTSCAFRVDKNIPAVKANYPTAEFQACSKVAHGISSCDIVEGESYKEVVDLKVQGYYSGTITVYSELCNVDFKYRYTNNELVSIPIEPNQTHSCLFSILVSPEYPREQNQDQVIGSLKGYLYVKHLVEPNTNYNYYLKNRQDSDMDIVFPMSQKGTLFFRGCGADFEKQYEDQVSVKLSDLIDTSKIQNCVLNGLYMFEEGSSIFLSILVSVFDKGYLKMSIPHLKRNRRKVKVYPDDTVTFIGVNQVYKYYKKNKFKVNRYDNIFRVISVSGRTAIGVEQGGELVWMQ